MRKLLFVLIMVLLVSFTGCRSDDKGRSSAGSPASGATESESTSAVDTSSATTSSTEATDSVPESEGNHTGSSVTESTKPSQPESSIPEVTETPSTKPTAPTEPLQSEPEPTSPPVTSKPEEPDPTNPDPEPSDSPTESITPPVDMEKEYERIIREATQYAEGYAAKGFTFVWDDSLDFSWESGAGWMGTPRVKYEGVDGVIGMLKRHIDIIVKTATDPGNGIPGYSANYKVVQVIVDGDIAFVVLYG